ncbi:hypothetical protein FRB90_011306 [Tulasnella sp. 427]|nr:hypothetical protein FRB90_011306 [Tulasnella sp. 427]
MPSNAHLSVLLLSVLSASVAADNATDLATLYKRRVPLTVATFQGTVNNTVLSNWTKTITPTGQWPDVNYATGCSAQRANWPADNHWLHVLPLAAAYTDVLPHASNLTQKSPYKFVGNATVEKVLDSAIDYWLDNDFTNEDCFIKGGLTTASCVCGTPGLWNPNWFSNVILTPRHAIQTALLLNKTIKADQRRAAVAIAERGESVFHRVTKGIVTMTGANAMDVASNTVDAGIVLALAGNSTGYSYIQGGFARAHNEIVVQPAAKADGIRPDGSFGQHAGIIYNGNYGKDYTNLALRLELSGAGTQWAANKTTRAAFSKLIDGSAWMIYKNTKTGIQHWDFSVLGRFIVFAVSDIQATAGLNIDFSQVQTLGKQWGDAAMTKVSTALLKSGGTSNAGNLVGNRMFYSNDYMVQRGKNYVTTVKMLSNRTANNECTNSQNPYGFHLGQGTVFNYGSGNEYEDIAAAWDWNLIPGITTDYGATPLDCDDVKFTGKKTFVGGASTGKIGVAAMDYQNPFTGTLSYRKAWFFLPNDVQHVIVSSIQKNSTADVYHVLDQKRTNGPVYLDGKSTSKQGHTKSPASSLWHDSVGYTFDGANATTVNVSKGDRPGNWSAIGTSLAPPSSVNIFQAWLKHDSSRLSTPIAYTVYPDTPSAKVFYEKVQHHAATTVYGTDVSAAMNKEQSVLMAVFWQASTTVTARFQKGSVTVQTNQAVIAILDLEHWTVAVSDPTQTLTSAVLTVQTKGLAKPKCKALAMGKTVTINFPQGVGLGKTVTAALC